MLRAVGNGRSVWRFRSHAAPSVHFRLAANSFTKTDASSDSVAASIA